MKITLYVAILAVFLAPIMANATVDVNLKYGQKSTEVSELQDFLADKGFLSVSPTGYFGLLTLKAVKAYQASVGLPATGFVGPMTRTEINKELSAILAESDQAELQETGTTTPVTVQAPVQQIIYQTIYNPAPVGSPVVPSTPVVETPKYVITGPEYRCESTNHVVAFRVTDDPAKFVIYASSTRYYNPSVGDGNGGTGAFTNMTANKTGKSFTEAHFSEGYGTFNYKAISLDSNSRVLSEKVGTYEVTECN